jgi:pimeloyl-ACP methyl ester carboxylesterase
MKLFAGLGLALALIMSAPAMAAPAAAKLTTTEMRVPGGAPGQSLYVRNKHLAGAARFGPAKTVLFVHGATYPASTAFDLELGGKSWMDELARQGFDVYLVDLTGYGRSSRPAAMKQPPEAGEPIETTDLAVADVGRVVDQVLKQTENSKLNLIGWSWGTTIMAGYAAEHPDKVERLVLYAPLWVTGATPPANPAKPGAYRLVTRQAAFDRWMNGVPEAKKASLIPPGWFDTWVEATFATDPTTTSRTPASLRAPTGTFYDAARYWGQNKPTWDPLKITVPIMLVVGEWDRDTPPSRAQTLFPLLTNAPWKQLVVIGEATHTMMMEKNRQQLFDAVDEFLTRKGP